MNNIKNFFFTKSNLLYCLVIVMMLSTISMIAPFTTELNVLLLLWGGIYFIYDLFTKKTCLKSRYKTFLLIYMVIFVVSILINFKNNPIDNIKTFVYTGFFLFVLYSYDSFNNDKIKIKSELININNIVIFISSITGLIALIMFVFLIQFTFKEVPQGFIYPKTPALWGLYGNPNSGGMVATLSIILTYINLSLYKINYKKSISKFRISYYVINIIIQWLYLVLCNSRGAVLSLIASILFITYYKLYNKLAIKYNLFKSIVISLIVSIIVLIACSASISISKSVLAYIPKYVESINSNNVNNTEGIIKEDEEITLDREFKSGHISTGRAEIWSYGLNTLKFSPLFGHGPGNIGLAKQQLYPNDTSKYIVTNNMHNGYIQILLSNGILGVASFLLFFIFIAKDSLKAILSLKLTISKENREIIALILAPIVAISVNGIFENVILLTQSYITTILWIYIGYLSLYLDNTYKNNNVKWLFTWRYY